MKAIIRTATIENAIRCWSRHATPQAFTHLCLSGVGGRALYNHVDPAASGLFILGHPTLGDWSSVPPLFKRPEGGPLHQYAGRTDVTQGPWQSIDDAPDTIELFVLGHVERFVSGRRRDGGAFCGLQLDDATLLDSISPAGIAYRSDTMQWGDVSDQYKLPDGSPRVDTDLVQDTTEVRWAEAA